MAAVPDIPSAEITPAAAAPARDQLPMTMLQTADPEVYAELLAASAAINRAYCERHGIEYRQFVGIKRGYHPWQATFNRVFLLEELIREGYSGWAFYLDADAFVADLEFDVREYCLRSTAAMIAAPGGLSGEHWDINTGVFLINLGSTDGRTIVRLWLDDVLRVPDEVLRKGEVWGELVEGDQRRLQRIFRRNPELAAAALAHVQREFFNDYKASFVRQILRATGMTVQQRTRRIRDEGGHLLAASWPLEQRRLEETITQQSSANPAPSEALDHNHPRSTIANTEQFLAVERLLMGHDKFLLNRVTDFVSSAEVRETLAAGSNSPEELSRSQIEDSFVRSLFREYGLSPKEEANDVSPDGVGVYGWLLAESGSGEGARTLIDSFRVVGIPVSAHAVRSFHYQDVVHYESHPEPFSRYRTLLFFLMPYWFMREFHRLPSRAVMGRRRIAYWPWELPVIPAAWAPAFNLVEEIWVPSTFNARAMAAATKLPVHVVPHSVKLPAIDKSEARRLCGLPQDDFIFLTAFDLNSARGRKNPQGALRAYLDAFPHSGMSSPLLVLKCHGKRNRETVLHGIRKEAKEARVIVIDDIYTPLQMRLLQASCDSFVSLHRSEGFGLNIAECMGFGKPCIATAFSGNLDYMNERNSILVPYRMRRVQPGEYLHGAGQWWADPVHEAAVAALRAVANGGLTIKALALTAKTDIARELSRQAVGTIAAATWRGQTRPFTK
jgi:glycosyltransferase involved in cell wall biosynthesis